MRTSNPVFSKGAYFQPQQQTRSNGQFSSGQQTLPGYAPGQDDPYAQQPYGQPQGSYQVQQPNQQYNQQGYAPQPLRPAGYVMTLDDVITKSAITMGLLFITAAISFFLFQGLDFVVTSGAMTVTAVAAFITVMIVSFRRNISPALVLLYSVLEGIFIGAISMVFNTFYPGIVVTAVLSTFVTAGLTLMVYKGLHIRVSGRFRQMIFIGTGAYAAVLLLNLLLSLFGVNIGIISVAGSVGWLAALCSLIGVALAVFNLIVDFDYIEQGVAAQAPASESWRAAFGLTVTMVWLYIELLRILSYFQRN